MHKTTALTLALMFLLFTGCEDKKPEQNNTPVENTTIFVSDKKQKNSTEATKQSEKTKQSDLTAADADEISEKEDNEPKENPNTLFQLFDMQNETHTATLAREELIFQNHTEPITLVQLFATWCEPCIGEIAYLNDLQEAYQEDLFITGILTRDNIDTSALNAFAKKHQIRYQILQNKGNNSLENAIVGQLEIQGTFPIPLIVIYLNGKYYTHYEGSIPVEMIKYDISQAQELLRDDKDQR